MLSIICCHSRMMCFTDFSSLEPKLSTHIKLRTCFATTPFPILISGDSSPSYNSTCPLSPPSLHPLQVSVNIAPPSTLLHHPVPNITNYQTNLRAAARIHLCPVSNFSQSWGPVSLISSARCSWHCLEAQHRLSVSGIVVGG